MELCQQQLLLLRGQEGMDKAVSCSVNGTPYSLYEFPVNLQITSNTIALHLDSVLCLHVCLSPISHYLGGSTQYSLGAPQAPMSQGA